MVCSRPTPAKGCWRLFDGRVGVVKEPSNMGEVGVQFDGVEMLLWFLPGELKYASKH